MQNKNKKKIKYYYKKKEKECDITKPYLENLNEDPLLNGKVKYSLKKGFKLLIIRKAFTRP